MESANNLMKNLCLFHFACIPYVINYGALVFIIWARMHSAESTAHNMPTHGIFGGLGLPKIAWQHENICECTFSNIITIHKLRKPRPSILSICHDLRHALTFVTLLCRTDLRTVLQHPLRLAYVYEKIIIDYVDIIYIYMDISLNSCNTWFSHRTTKFYNKVPIYQSSVVDPDQLANSLQDFFRGILPSSS